MKIILVATDAKGKNVVFVSDALRAYSLDEAVRLAKEGKFENLYVVKSRNGTYLRTRRDTPTNEQLEKLSVSAHQLFAFADDIGSALSHLALKQYLKMYERELKIKEKSPFIVINFISGISHREAKEKLQLHRELIFEASKRFEVDPYLLGAILIDELAQLKPFENILEEMAVFLIGKNSSGGIAQVKVETARGLIQDGYYNPKSDDPQLSQKVIKKTSREYLYHYIKEPRHNIFFAAAHIRVLIDHWKKFADLNTRPEIVGTLYSIGRGKQPHSNPQPSERGLRIAEEFYPLARKWLV